MSILLAILGLSVLVIAHESGHYLVARAFKMRVTRFSIGFGPALFRYKPKDSPTTFQVCAIPFLAYVQIAGMNPAEDVDPNDPEIYPNKSLFARMLTIFAGPAANYITASVIAFVLALSGMPEGYSVSPMTIESIDKGPAQRAKLLEGDVILAANGERIRNVDDLRRINQARGARATEYRIRRGEREFTVTMTPENRTPAARRTRENPGQFILAVQPKLGVRYVTKPVGEAAIFAIEFPALITGAQIAGIADMIRRADASNLMGPVGMTEQFSKASERGLADYVMLMIILSVALGMFNLLPFPALDGGRLMFLAYELIARRRPNERFEAVVHTVGLLFLLVVVALVSVREIGKLLG